MKRMKKGVSILLNLPSADYKLALKTLADRNARSMNGQVVFIIKEFLLANGFEENNATDTDRVPVSFPSGVVSEKPTALPPHICEQGGGEGRDTRFDYGEVGTLPPS